MQTRGPPAERMTVVKSHGRITTFRFCIARSKVKLPLQREFRRRITTLIRRRSYAICFCLHELISSQRGVKVKPPPRRKFHWRITTRRQRITTVSYTACCWRHEARHRRPLRTKAKLRLKFRRWRHAMTSQLWRHIRRWAWLICGWSCVMRSYGDSSTRAPMKWSSPKLAGKHLIYLFVGLCESKVYYSSTL